MTLDFRTKAKTIFILITLLIFVRCDQNSRSEDATIPLLSLVAKVGNTDGIESQTNTDASDSVPNHSSRPEMISNSEFDPNVLQSEGPDLIPTGITNFFSLPAGTVFQEGVFIMNSGNATASGNSPSQKGYKVDFFLSKNQDGVEAKPIRLGSLFVTKDLAPGHGEFLQERLQIPRDTSAGSYNLCVNVDPEEIISESKEDNNTFCVSLQITNSSNILPDLVIPRASIYPSGMKCRAGKPMLFITAEVKNIGNSASPSSLNVGLLSALDTKGEVWGAGNGVWGNGIGLEAIQPGQTVTVTFPIYYLQRDPSFMEGSHTFDLRVNRGNWIQESDTKNNVYKKSLEITIPDDYCKNHPG
ncbi:cell adhesion protein [Leptospira gomenensis]|uniref:Cell adhesion protein n=1 Tax=Leptospira gomenensis TaxID=2484974 RepID=A0A5F1YGR5_9LEPT|nr:CARDB domain-containing protein [Leptospira gomenensis]TGK31542.1 cell adhesion protein [Leptospira gomenensis]TGK44192.1 cell adhesion protein [Leptospira gomenensis]TGK46247.1 cell adhesion protein [Leptospira gomenensis]TGK54772.1 cell adhesion protein [Leptospira gomenensis]